MRWLRRPRYPKIKTQGPRLLIGDPAGCGNALRPIRIVDNNRRDRVKPEIGSHRRQHNHSDIAGKIFLRRKTGNIRGAEAQRIAMGSLAEGGAIWTAFAITVASPVGSRSGGLLAPAADT